MATIGEIYLEERGGNVELYRSQMYDGLRPGQAFFNALSERDKNRLRGSIYDPFYQTDGILEKIEKAIEWLLDTEDLYD